MTNELLLAGSVILIYGSVLIFYRLFGKSGLFVMSAIATVLANIEVCVLIVAFGLEQTLGNVMFASTFVITDILSECETKKDANKAVWVGIAASLFFLVVSQGWLLYSPAANDIVMESMRGVFSGTSRMILSSLAVYVVSQFFDVWVYHKWWALTTRLSGDRRKFLWLRNNVSTLMSQLINAFLFNFLAFWGTYDTPSLISLSAATYIIYIFTSLLDTPVVYVARKMHENGTIKN